ncbi:MAG: glycosyltransferase [Acidimicrobiales bacterium]
MTTHVFVTVGAQMAFDRLVHAVEAWYGREERPGVEVFAQVGPTANPPTALASVASLGPDGFAARMAWADVVVSHAGMGTIISALVDGVPLVVMPRRGTLMETRNDHQVATVAHFADRPGITAVADEAELLAVLDDHAWSTPDPIGNHASPSCSTW